MTELWKKIKELHGHIVLGDHINLSLVMMLVNKN